MTRVGILSDTHLDGVTRDLEEICGRFFADVDMILHAGDVVCEEVVGFLGRVTFHGVHGNMDPPGVRALLPSHRVITIGHVRVGLTHGGGPPEGLEDRVLLDFPGVDLIVYGHSHRPVDKVKKGVRLFNPGTATGPVRGGTNTVGLLEIGQGRVSGRIISV